VFLSDSLGAFVSFALWAVGVVQRRRCAGHFCIDGDSMLAVAVGVGSITARVSDWNAPLLRVMLCASSTVGVGHLLCLAIDPSE
jgi:hypothetical protein